MFTAFLSLLSGPYLLTFFGVVDEDAPFAIVVNFAVLTVDEVSTRLNLNLLRDTLGRVRSHHGYITTTPVNNERFTDEEEHDGDLRDGEEAPDARLLHKVVRQQRGQHGTEKEKEHTL